MLRKRDLPICAPLPGISFDIDKLKEGYEGLKHKMRNLWKAILMEKKLMK